MDNAPMHTPEFLRQILRYEPETGKLFWKPRPVDMFKDGGKPKEANCNSWNARFAGNEAFTYTHPSGYRLTTVRGVALNAHRVAWAIYHGEWPDRQVDHINHNRSDNRMSNLRVVSQAENARNQSIAKNNKSGTAGVSWCVKYKRWIAKIGVDGKPVHIGNFTDFGSARDARAAAEKKYAYHQNHGQPSGGAS